MAKKENTTKRARNFACMVYPESAPENWMDILTDLKIPSFVSPLHENDIDPQNQPKKPHYHVMLMFEGMKSDEQVRDIFDKICGVGFERVNSIRGYARYLCHLDNPEKAQYNIEDCKSLAGADYFSVITLPSDKYNAIGEMMDHCVRNQVVCYAQLLIYCREYRFDWFKILCDSGTFVMKEFLKSYKWELDSLSNYDPEDYYVSER